MNYDEDPPFEIARYREMQKALPGADTLYTLMLAHIEIALPSGGRVLVVGAGGGREVEALLGSDMPFGVVGVDPSRDMLDIARWYAERGGRSDKVQLLQGLTDDIDKPAKGFDAATAMFVMQFLPDDDSDGGKLAFLKAIRERLGQDGLLVHADVSVENCRDRIAPVFLRHARLAGLPEDAVSVGLKVIAAMPVVGAARTSELFQAAGFSAPALFFQTLWYRAWTARAV